MAIIICPTLTCLTEFDMFTSEMFHRCGHEITGLRLRNHDKEATSWVAGTYVLPKGITISRKQKKFNKRVHTKTEVQFTLDAIEPVGGIERLQKFLAKNHKGMDFYVEWMITSTTGKTRHSCKWVRKPASARNSRIVALHLKAIDGKKVLDHYSQEEMWAIVGKLPDDKCRLRSGVITKTFVECDPIDR